MAIGMRPYLFRERGAALGKLLLKLRALRRHRLEACRRVLVLACEFLHEAALALEAALQLELLRLEVADVGLQRLCGLGGGGLRQGVGQERRGLARRAPAGAMKC